MILFCVCTWGCAANQTRQQLTSAVARGAYADALQTYEKTGRDRAVLRMFAESILLQDAQLGGEPQRQRTAFTELALLGTRSRPALERLAQPGLALGVRVLALRSLMALGDADARRALRRLAFDGDPEIADIAFSALDASADRALLLRALSAPRLARRLAAVGLLAGNVEPDTLQPLAEVSRSDPEPSLRAAALFALERQGEAAAFAFEPALKDENESVRIAALLAFARAAPGPASRLLDLQLGAATTRQTLAAAVALLQMQPPREAARAHDAIERGLSASESQLRSHTAVLIRGLPRAEQDPTAVRNRLAVETVPEVQLALALALGADDAAARRSLVTLSQGTSVTAAQAARELAKLGDAAAQTRLIALRTSSSSVTRATIARSLGREQREPEAVAPLLADGDPSVRAAAAGAILGGLLST